MTAPPFEGAAPSVTRSDVCERDISTLPRARPATPLLSYPPFSTGSREERDRQLLCLQGIIAGYHGAAHPLIAMLRAGEDDATALARAQQAVEAMPSLFRRRALAQLAAVTWPSRLGGG